MYDYCPPIPKLPKWALNAELATQKFWSITAGGCLTGQAIQICNHIIMSPKLAKDSKGLQQKAWLKKHELIQGRSSRIKALTTHEVILLSAHRK